MQSLSRRTFVAGAALSARSYARVTGANDRIHLGVIGCGGQSMHHQQELMKMRESDNVEIATVCDLYTKRVEQSAKLTSAKIVKDYRTLLEDNDLDYVLIATPEHWHYQMVMDAASAGRHIYCEKPMAWSVEQGKKIVARLKDSPLKMQVGVQGMSDDSYITAQKFVKQDALGKVVLAQIDYSRNYDNDIWDYPIDADARPGENLDWKTWLGPAPKRPWDPDRFFRWRRYWDYSGGIASDLFIHRVTRIIRALDLKFPERVVATGGKFAFPESKTEVPDTFNVLLDYPESLTVQLISSLGNGTPVPHLLRGRKATLEFTRTGFTIRPQRRENGQPEGQEIVHQKTGAESVALHHRNLLNAIRKNEPLNCDPMLGYYGLVACDMAVRSYRKQRYLKWDAARERVA